MPIVTAIDRACRKLRKPQKETKHTLKEYVSHNTTMNKKTEMNMPSKILTTLEENLLSEGVNFATAVT